MKKHLAILACLLPCFAVQAQQAPASAPVAASAASTSARNHLGATARSQQNRHAKDAACQKTAKDQGLEGLAFKQAVMACMR